MDGVKRRRGLANGGTLDVQERQASGQVDIVGSGGGAHGLDRQRLDGLTRAIRPVAGSWFRRGRGMRVRKNRHGKVDRDVCR
jgi:hypothetical protein